MADCHGSNGVERPRQRDSTLTLPRWLTDGGFVPMARAIYRDHARYIGPHATLVYFALANHADRDMQCWPAVATIAKTLGISASSVRRALTRLEEAGLVAVARSHDGINPNTYTLSPIGGTPTGVPQTGVANGNGCPTDRRGVANRQGRGVCGIPEQESLNKTQEQEHPPPPQQRAGASAARVCVSESEPSPQGEQTHQTGSLPAGDSFKRFWAAYPKKKNREGAWQAWRQLNPSLTLVQTILAAIACLQEHDDEWRRGFAPNAKTFILEKRWTDPPQGGRAGSPSRNPKTRREENCCDYTPDPTPATVPGVDR